MKQNKGWTLIEILICVSTFALIVVVLTGLIGGINLKPTSGAVTGQVVKIAHEGIVSKTYEIELVRGGLTDGSGTMGRSYSFTVNNDEILKGLTEAMEKKQTVVVHYKGTLFFAPWNSASNGEYVTSFTLETTPQLPHK